MQQLRWLLGGVLAMLSVWTVIFMELEAWIWLLLITAGVATALVRPQWPARIPRWAHRLAFPFIVAWFVGDLWLTSEVLPAMVRLDMLLLLYRGITYRQRRDDLQVIVLGLFLVVVAGVLTVSLAFAGQILAFTACALALLLAVTLSETGSKTPGAKTPAAALHEAPAWARHVHWGGLLRRVRAVTDWRIVALGGGLFAGLVALSALLFLTIPRFQLENSLFLERFITKKARSGFSETVRFNDVTDIQQDNSVALSVDVSDRTQIPPVPYWRMLVLDEYRDGAFRLSPGARQREFTNEFTRANIPGRGGAMAGDPVYWTFYLESGVSRYLPLLGDFVELRFREAQKFRVAPELKLIALRDEPVTMTAYRVEGMRTGAALYDPGFGRQLRLRRANPRAATALLLSTGLGEGDRAALTDVLGAIGQPASAGDFGKRATAWLDARHGYALKSQIPSGAGDPLVRWLGSREGGHCELFAGSLVLLARTAGIPARVVVGFRGGSWNGYSNNFTLRNADAHAWCELFDTASESWIRVDPTPGATAEESQPEAALARRTDRSWTARFDSLRVFWYRRIVNFDQHSQVETLKAAKDAAEQSGRQLQEWLQQRIAAVKRLMATPWTSGGVAWLLAAITAGAGSLWAAISFGPVLRLWLLARQRGPGDAVRREAGKWLVKLTNAERGTRSAERGREEPAGRSQNPECRIQHERTEGRRDERERVVTELQRLRFGARANWDEPTRVFRDARRVWRARKRGDVEPRELETVRGGERER